MRQMTIFDWMPTVRREPDVGEYVSKPGQIIPHIMRPAYIGKKVLINVSTQNRLTFQCGILEKYIQLPYDGGAMRSIVYTGKKQRSLITHGRYPYNAEIYECLPWDAYPARMEAIYRKVNT